MPFVPAKLRGLLDSPFFSPFSHDGYFGEGQQRTHFVVLAKSIIFQIFSALAYLHDPSRKIAHRDVKPGNILLTHTGCVRLIDFGISWSEDASDCMWPEPIGGLCFDVCTGHVLHALYASNFHLPGFNSPYRSPELLFGSKDYDPLAVDLWGLGATLAEFFMPLRLLDRWEDSDSDGDDESGSDTAIDPEPFIVPVKLRSQVVLPGAKWIRDSLFDASRGSIGLAWSIFQIRGTPNSGIWLVWQVLVSQEATNSCPSGICLVTRC